MVRESRLLHPSLVPQERRALLHRGVALFNTGEHFAAHEAWETVWRSNRPEPRALLQGMIQAAAALHQILVLLREEGPRGTLAKALRNLEPFRPGALGLDLEGLCAGLAEWQRWLDQRGERPPVPPLRLTDPDQLR